MMREVGDDLEEDNGSLMLIGISNPIIVLWEIWIPTNTIVVFFIENGEIETFIFGTIDKDMIILTTV